MKYKVGDKVRVRKDLKEGLYGKYKLFCNESMVKKAGMVVTIKDINHLFYPRYVMEEDGWYWCDEMFEGLVNEAQPEETVKLYTWQDLCDYEILLHEKWRIVNEQRREQYLGHKSVMQTLRGEYLDAIKRATDKLGREVLKSKAKELGFEV